MLFDFATFPPSPLPPSVICCVCCEHAARQDCPLATQKRPATTEHKNPIDRSLLNLRTREKIRSVSRRETKLKEVRKSESFYLPLFFAKVALDCE